MQKAVSYIFFLQFDEKLPEYYFRLAAFCSELGVSIVPIKPNDLLKTASAGKHFVVAVVDSLTHLKDMIEVRKDFLNLAITNNKITLFELSSFRKISPNKKLKEENYLHVSLPVDLLTVARFITKHSKKSRDLETNKWPGGRRGRLPGAESVS